MTRPHGATWLGPVLGLAALTGCIAIATPSEAPPDAAPGAWRAAAAMPAARQELAIAEVGGRVYADAPPRHGMGAAVVGHRIYLPGGGRRPGPGRTAVTEAFEP
jgi:hypothetical protein